MKNKIAHPETLSIHSIENFISSDDTNNLLLICKKELSEYKGEFNTVHPSDEFSKDEAVKIYEPNGRSELGTLSPDIYKILDMAIHRNLPSIQTIFPNVKRVLPWNYVEYNSNQYCTSHVDYIDKTELNEIIYAGIGVMLQCPDEGGELYVETCGSPDFILNDEVAPNLNYSNNEFINMPRSKWTVNQPIGTAILYGTQIIHGTNPVKKGKCCKLISWLAG